MAEKVTDKHVLAAVDEMMNRSVIGTVKYGTTLERTDLSITDWIQHAKEEAMDLVNYLQRLQSYVEELESFGKLKKYSMRDLVEIVEEHENSRQK